MTAPLKCPQMLMLLCFRKAHSGRLTVIAGVGKLEILRDPPSIA